MSIKWVSTVWDQATRVKGTPLLVLLCLADHAQDETGECWPSVARLAQRTRVSERAVQSALTGLEERGYIARDMRPGHSTIYRLLEHQGGEAGFTPAESAPPPIFTTGGEAGFTIGVKQASPRTVIEPSVESSPRDGVVVEHSLGEIHLPPQALSNLGITPNNAEAWTQAYREMHAMAHECVPVESLVTYLRYCRKNRQRPDPDRAVQWFTKDQRDFRVAVETAARTVEPIAPKKWYE